MFPTSNSGPGSTYMLLSLVNQNAPEAIRSHVLTQCSYHSNLAGRDMVVYANHPGQVVVIHTQGAEDIYSLLAWVVTS